MALIHVPPVEAPTMDSRRRPIDEIINLSDRRRVLLHVVLDLDVDADTADEIFEGVSRSRSPVPRPAASVESGYFAVEDTPTA